MAPHLSPDDNLLSRLSRAGIRITLQEAHASLRAGEDWEPSGVHTRSGGALVWNDKAGWIRPAALVRAWLAQDGITWRGGARVQRIARDGAQHVLLAADEGELARADLVIVAAALDSARLLGGRLQLNAVRGQVSWGWRAPDDELPATPLNGNGHFIPRAPVDGREAWLTGSTYDRGDTSVEVRAGDHLANLERLRTLAPEAAERLAARFEHEEVQAWAGVRCTSADRRPLVGFVEPGLAVLTALGSRGLTFAALCAELLAASVHGEPLPLPRKLADALAVARQLDARATAPSAAAR
jgi:tRNA 5-methylaminomethyl-2-thiouridine biosynthesis bifunctional protein